MGEIKIEQSKKVGWIQWCAYGGMVVRTVRQYTVVAKESIHSLQSLHVEFLTVRTHRPVMYRM